MDTYSILDGIGKNMRKSIPQGVSDDFSSMLSYVHIMNIKVSSPGWIQFSKGLAHPNCVLKKLIIHMVEFDREQLNALAEGIKENHSVKHLDLAYNNIKDSYGDIFGRIITDQG